MRHVFHHLSLATIAVASVGITAGCAVEQGSPGGDPLGERAGKTAEALGGATPAIFYQATDGNGAVGTAWVSSAVDHNNLHFKFGYFDPQGTGYWDFALVSWGIAGSGSTGQDTNESGGFDLNNVTPGTLWQFQDALCFHNTLNQSSCSNWSPWVFAYAQAPGTTWIDSDTATPDQLAAAVETGWEITPNGTKNSLKTCAVFFRNGEHVGKFFGGNCFIGWGSFEQVVQHAMVLSTTDPGVGWTWTTGGTVPARAVAAGWEHGNYSQYACRAWSAKASGYTPGKALPDGCHYSWGGVEHVESGWYQVLTN